MMYAITPQTVKCQGKNTEAPKCVKMEPINIVSKEFGVVLLMVRVVLVRLLWVRCNRDTKEMLVSCCARSRCCNSQEKWCCLGWVLKLLGLLSRSYTKNRRNLLLFVFGITYQYIEDHCTCCKAIQLPKECSCQI